MRVRSFIATSALATCLLGSTTAIADDSSEPATRIGSVCDRVIKVLRLEGGISLGETYAQGGLGLWLPVDPARHIRYGLDAFELGFGRNVDDVRYQRSPLLLGIRITLGQRGTR